MLIYGHQTTEIGSPSVEPVNLVFAKEQKRIDHSDEDILVASLITAAREYCEDYCARSFVQHTYRADLRQFFDHMRLPLGPVQTVESIKYWDTASPSVLQTLSTSIYSVHGDDIWRVTGESWPSIASRHDAVQITYKTGYSDLASPENTVANVPESAKAAMMLLVGDLYENREAQVLYPGQMLESRTFKMLLDRLRQFR